MKTDTSVCTFQRLIATTVVGLVEFHARLCSLFWLDIFYSTTQKDSGKLKSFL